MSRENMGSTSSTEPQSPKSGLPGDPNCPYCGGLGYIQRDLPITHPDFGKLQMCVCYQKTAAQSERSRLYQLSNLDAFRQMTFDNFRIQGRMGLGDQQVRSLQFAYNKAYQFAQALQGWLILVGSYGSGKTHLAAAIANQAIQAGTPTLFLTVPDLLDWLRSSFSNTDASFEQRLEEIRSIPLLVLDDLGTQNATPWAEEKLYQIINHRYTHHLPLVVTTNVALSELDGRISSRMQDPDLSSVTEITAPDFRSPINDESGSSLSTLTQLSDRTFGSFSMREFERLPAADQQSLQKAFTAATQFAEEPKGWLVFMGDYFTGKTHLAAAIGNYRKSTGEDPIFIGVPELLDHLRAAFSPNSNVSYDRRFDEVRTAPLLILDDLGTQSATPWAREKLFQLLNYRYNGKLPTVITTPQELSEIDPRIRTRLLDRRICTIYAITTPPYMAQPAAAPVRRGKRASG